MDNKNLIISDEWSLEDNTLKVTQRGKECVYSVSSEVATCIHIGNQYFVFDSYRIQCMYDANTGIIQPFSRTSEGNLEISKDESINLHVRLMFTQFLFEEFLRNCGISR